MDTKYIILVGDGMGDYPLEDLGGRTPLEAAHTPNMTKLVALGRMGTVCTIPDSMEPGSDVANMSLLGYDPVEYHTGRAPLEAASMGIPLMSVDVAFRCNLVTIETTGDGVELMGDYSAGHITTAESHMLISSLQKALEGSPMSLYAGVSYRHLLVWPNGVADLDTTPPHDISGQSILPHLAAYTHEPVLLSFMEKAAEILRTHPVNRERVAQGKRPANAVWLWGQGHAPAMPTLKERFGLTGVMVSAVDLLKGLGVYAGLESVSVPGATGYLDTNYAGKVEAVLNGLKKSQLAYLHIEAPDEAGHEGSLSKKIDAIEAFDAKVVGPIMEGAKAFSHVRLLLVTDHLTPIEKRTHVKDPVPFLLVEDLDRPVPISSSSAAVFSERVATSTGWNLRDGVELFRTFIGKSEIF